MKNLIIIGTGAFAREVFWHAQQSIGYDVDWRIKGFLDGDVKLSPEDYARLPENIPVLGDVNGYEICADDVFTCAVGTPEARRLLCEKISARGGEFVNLVSELAYVMPTVKLGRGVIIAPHTDIGDGAVIGNFVATNAMTIIGHDVTIGDFTCIMPHANIAGWSKIGSEVFVGSGAIILPRAKVDDGATVGAGSVVLKRVKAGTKVFGNPAVEI